MKEKELVLQVMTMPADCNPMGKIFGGFVMSKMDQAAAITCGSLHYVTKAATNIEFLAPCELGDILQCYATIMKSGKTSHTIQITVYVKDEYKTKIAEGEFTMVRIDKRMRPIAHRSEMK
jgi:acyl-CoA thioesterase YciA